MAHSNLIQASFTGNFSKPSIFGGFHCVPSRRGSYRPQFLANSRLKHATQPASGRSSMLVPLRNHRQQRTNAPLSQGSKGVFTQGRCVTASHGLLPSNYHHSTGKSILKDVLHIGKCGFNCHVHLPEGQQEPHQNCQGPLATDGLGL